MTGRVGITAAPTVLVYAKGGGAWVRDEFTLTAAGTGATLANTTTNQSGWTVGGGVEWAFAGNWSAFAEYNYLDFGTPSVNFTSAIGGTVPVNVKQNINSFMVGINYRFGAWAYCSLKRDDFSSIRHRALAYCWSMIFSENRYPPRIKSGAGFLGIML